MINLAVIYYSATGHVFRLAEALASGGEHAGAVVRLRRVAELAPEHVIRSQNAWHEHHLAARERVPEAVLDDLDWADAIAFGTPTRFGLPASQLKQFIDQAGPLWAAGKLSGKLATSFTSAQNDHGGQESTILALNNVFYHWGAHIVAPGYTHPDVFGAGGNPYGTSSSSGDGTGPVSDQALAAAAYQGRRLVTTARQMAAGAGAVEPSGVGA